MNTTRNESHLEVPLQVLHHAVQDSGESPEDNLVAPWPGGSDCQWPCPGSSAPRPATALPSWPRPPHQSNHSSQKIYEENVKVEF